MYEEEKTADVRPREKELYITRVKNGYVISERFSDNEKQVAMLLNDMLEIVKNYFEEKV